MRRAAFTLIELMISMVLMLLLIFGVNQVFKSVGQASGTTITLSKITRDAQAAQAVMVQDMAGIVTQNTPFLIIKSARVAAFKNHTEELAAPVPTDPMWEWDSSNTGTVALSNAIYNDRNHRVDQLKFFARGSFKRQTGNDGTFVDDLGSSEAQISYGHLSLYNGTSADRNASPSFPAIGSGTSATNPNNFYATQWIVGRNSILLAPHSFSGGAFTSINPALSALNSSTAVMRDKSNVDQKCYATGANLSALHQNINANDATNSKIMSSRYDLADTSIDNELQAVRTWATVPPLQTWYSRYEYRFWSNPIFLKPLDSYKASQAVPLFLPSCTQFIVEYAGDWLNQNPTTGAITAATPYLLSAGQHTGSTDGIIDFIVDQTTSAHSIRWYGFPRDANGDGKIVHGGANPNLLVDVVPLRDVIKTIDTNCVGAPMEHFASLNTIGADYAANISPNGTYICAWGPAQIDNVNNTVPLPNPPMMMRIIFTIDDPNGRLAEGQTFTYVFKMQ